MEGDLLDPAASSGYGDMGYISVLHAVYQVCVRPFVRPDESVLEIGPGRGAWTRTMLAAVQVSDFHCEDLPASHFDFLFSFGVFCHITPEGQRAYFRNLFPKEGAARRRWSRLAISISTMRPCAT